MKSLALVPDAADNQSKRKNAHEIESSGGSGKLA